MERLTKVMNCDDGNKLYDYSNEVIREYKDFSSRLELMFEKLAEYEDLEEQGLLLRLPCKVGDTVYITSYFDIGTYNIKYAKADVRDFTHFTSCGFCVVITSKIFGKLTIPFSEIGKSVFLTQAEDEQKLKKMESD